jgi:hypothetical protein
MNTDAAVDAADRQADRASGKGTDQYALELAKQREKDKAAGIYATNPMGKAAQELASDEQALRYIVSAASAISMFI